VLLRGPSGLGIDDPGRYWMPSIVLIRLIDSAPHRHLAVVQPEADGRLVPDGLPAPLLVAAFAGDHSGDDGIGDAGRL
jgi:hypothetical protein